MGCVTAGQPSQSLQTYVSNLRQLLGRESIATDKSGYRLTAEAESIDVERFRPPSPPRQQSAKTTSVNPRLASASRVS